MYDCCNESECTCLMFVCWNIIRIISRRRQTTYHASGNAGTLVCKKLQPLSKTGVSQHNGGPIEALLKPFNTKQGCDCLKGFMAALNRAPIMLRDASHSDSYTCDFSCWCRHLLYYFSTPAQSRPLSRPLRLFLNKPRIYGRQLYTQRNLV